MYNLRKHEVLAAEIAEYLNSPLIGEDFPIQGPNFIKSPRSLTKAAQAPTEGKVLLISDREIPDTGCDAYIVVEKPDLDLARVLLEFFANPPIHAVHPTAVVSEDAKIGRNVMIGAHAVIGPYVEIGDSTVILNNVVINGPAQIGKQCVIKDGAVIGSEGYGFIEDEDGTPFHAPQLGRILIGDRVWVGSNSTIERAMVDDTVIRNDVKIDDLVHIGNGSIVGEKSMLTAGAVIAYDVVIGQKVTVAPNAVIRESVNIADDVTIGQGAVVVRDIETGGVYAGNPATLLRKTKS